jgi:hypothetical protein
MSDLKPSGEATVQSIQKTAYSAEFDPVSEIRKLRQNITHHIQVLHSHSETTSSIPVLSVNENNGQKNGEKSEKEETTEDVETIEVGNEINSKTVFSPVTTENKTEKNRTPEFPANELIQQIHQARQLLAQLQIIPRVNQPQSDKAAFNKTLSQPEESKPENTTVPKTDLSETPERFFPPLAVLKIMNTVLMWCGVLGILFSFQYVEQDSRLGLTIMGAGLTLASVGLLGRFCSFTFRKKSILR